MAKVTLSVAKLRLDSDLPSPVLLPLNPAYPLVRILTCFVVVGLLNEFNFILWFLFIFFNLKIKAGKRCTALLCLHRGRVVKTSETYPNCKGSQQFFKKSMTHFLKTFIEI